MSRYTGMAESGGCAGIFFVSIFWLVISGIDGI